MIYANTVLDPSFLTAGSGTWSYVQVLNGFQDNAGVNANYASWLDDGLFPYDNYPWKPADGKTIFIFTDAPGFSNVSPNNLGAVNYPVTYSESLQLSTYIFYLPPGASSIYIPIELVSWQAKGTGTGNSATSWTPSNPDQGSGAGSPSPYPTFPTWVN
jgi:hypothetical protein